MRARSAWTARPKQYLIWVKGIVTRGDFGYSFAYKRPVQS